MDSAARLEFLNQLERISHDGAAALAREKAADGDLQWLATVACSDVFVRHEGCSGPGGLHWDTQAPLILLDALTLPIGKQPEPYYGALRPIGRTWVQRFLAQVPRGVDRRSHPEIAGHLAHAAAFLDLAEELRQLLAMAPAPVARTYARPLRDIAVDATLLGSAAMGGASDTTEWLIRQGHDHRHAADVRTESGATWHADVMVCATVLGVQGIGGVLNVWDAVRSVLPEQRVLARYGQRALHAAPFDLESTPWLSRLLSNGLAGNDPVEFIRRCKDRASGLALVEGRVLQSKARVRRVGSLLCDGMGSEGADAGIQALLRLREHGYDIHRASPAFGGSSPLHHAVAEKSLYRAERIIRGGALVLRSAGQDRAEASPTVVELAKQQGGDIEAFIMAAVAHQALLFEPVSPAVVSAL